MSDPVTYELHGDVATIAMDDGKVNALSTRMLTAVHEALDRAERDGAVVVLSGRERYFSAGFDLAVFSTGGEQVLEMLTLGATLAQRILAHPRPVVAACSGHAVAAGSFLLLAADVRIGADGPFKLGLNEVAIGLTVPWFAIELARHRLAPAYFDAAVVRAAMFDPHEAVVAGLLDRVAEPEQLQAAALTAARELAKLDAAAHAATKLRARARALEAVRSAIDSELTLEALGA
jgi:enoyl-CoA hydratase